MKRLVLLLSVLLLAASPFIISSDVSAEEFAQPDDIRVAPSKSDINLNAGESITIHLDIVNRFHDALIVYVFYTDKDPDITVDFPNDNRVEIDGKGLGTVKLEISVSKYARSTDHELSFEIRINDPNREHTIEADASHSLMISVSSELSAGKQYNKIMGVLDNNLPAPFNTPLSTTIITIAIWILIGVVVAYGVVPVLLEAVKKVEDRIDNKGGQND